MKTTGKAVTKAIAFILALVCLMTFVPFGTAADDENVMNVNAAGVLTADEIKKNDVSPLAGSYRKELSQGVKNILLRARQMYEVTWTPLADVQADSFTCPGTFVKGQTYQGIPYGQPVHKGRYVGSNATIDEFVAATKNINSDMYKTKGENTYNYTQQVGNKQIRYCPYFSNDCSGFVSYAWGIKRMTTSSFSSKKTKDGSSGYKDLGKDINKLEPGHAICTDGSGHIILIYDVEYDSNGKLLRVTTLEQVEPQMRKKVWGVGGNAGTLDELQKFMNGTLTTGAKPYSIIEYMNADSVTFTATTAAPIGLETMINKIELPVSSYAENTAATGSAKLDSSEATFEIKGWSLNKKAITSFEYRIDKGLWQKLDAGYDSSVFEVENSHFKGISDLNTYSGVALMPSAGEHILTVRATFKDGTKTEVARVNINSVSSSDERIPFILTMDKFEVCGKNYGGGGSTAINRDVSVSDPKDALIVTQGWCVAKGGIKTFEYSVDGGVWKPAIQNYRQDVFNATKNSYGADCKDLNSFSSTFDLTYLSSGKGHSFKMRLVSDAGDTEEIVNITLNIGTVSDSENENDGIIGNIVDVGKNTFPDSAVVEFKKVNASDKIAAVLKGEVKDSLYTLAEIKITDGGKSVDIKDTVGIGVEMPEGYRAKNIVVYAVGADGKLTELDSDCVNEKITFKASKLGTFAIVNNKATTEAPVTEAPADKNETAAPDSDNTEKETESTDNGEKADAPSETAPAEDNTQSDDTGSDKDAENKVDSSEKDKDGGLPVVAIIGIIAGSVALLAVVAAVVIIVLARKKNKTV